MPGTEEGNAPASQRIEIADENPPPQEDSNLGGPVLRDSKGWDGKLRVPKSALLHNPEALSDPEYSDDENVFEGEVVAADEDLLEGEPEDTDEILCVHSRIQSIPALHLERFKQAARVCLRQNLIQDMEGISALADSVHELDLYDNLISHIRGLDELTHLTSLDLSFNKIKHIKHVNHLKDLTDLYFVANKISNIEGLDGLAHLRQLELGSNRIREIKNLDSLVALEELWVAKNKITQISGLSGLPHLRLLSIQSNRITDLSPLREVPQLEELYASHNLLESVKGLENNKKLRVLEISNNKVKSLEGLAPLVELEEFWASYNQIGDIAEIERVLGDKKGLTTVYFEGNPLQLRSPALYRNKVRLALPQVQQIDATFVRVS